MKPVRAIVPQSVLAWLLHYANSNPSHCRQLFYKLKSQLLHKYAELEGHDIQEIVKECHGGFDGMGYPAKCKGNGCRHCGGTGVYDRRWIRLQRWKWGKYIFHLPIGYTYIKPESIQIHGRVEHADYGLASREAELWLYIVTLNFELWWRVLSTCAYCKPKFWPMCRLQSWAMWASITFRWRRCWICGKQFPTWGSGWMACDTCRHAKPFLQQDNDVPF